MRHSALAILTGCCAIAGPAALVGIAEADDPAQPSTAFPKAVFVKVSPLDLVDAGNTTSQNSVGCSTRDEGCLGLKARITLTLTAATAKTAGISKRKISSVVYTETAARSQVFKHDLSRSETRKLRKVEKAGKNIKMVISVKLTKGDTTQRAPSQLMIGPNGDNNDGLQYVFKLGSDYADSGGRG